MLLVAPDPISIGAAVAQPPKKKVTPKPHEVEEFVSVESEPQPLRPIQSYLIYPESAKAAGLQGSVLLKALIDASGVVRKVEVMHALNPVLDSAAVQTIRRVRFSPALQNGSPIRVWYDTWIDFKLNATEMSQTNIADRDISSPKEDAFVWIPLKSLPEPLAPIAQFCEYPKHSLQNGDEGTVEVSMLVGETGRLEQLQTFLPTNRDLLLATRSALQNEHYRSALGPNGEPIKAWIHAAVSFGLPTKKEATMRPIPGVHLLMHPYPNTDLNALTVSPSIAKQLGNIEEGVIKATVDKHGKLQTLTLSESSSSTHSAASREALQSELMRTLTFLPAQVDGEEVEVEFEGPYSIAVPAH